MPAKTVRNIVTGSGTVTVTVGSRVATFSASQSFKPGAVINTAAGNMYTIDSGSGTTWTLIQAATASESAVTYQTTDPSASRGRGGVGGTGSELTPNAVHYVFQSPVDDAGSPDCYIYVDTVMPENGVHPYTMDQMVSSFKSAQTARQVIPDLATRVRRLEGVIRSGRPSGSLSQDYRINDLLQRCYNLEVWANSAGHFGTPPAAGPHPTYAESDFLANGDPA